MKFVKKKVRNILESNFFVRYLIHQTTPKHQKKMENLNTSERQAYINGTLLNYDWECKLKQHNGRFWFFSLRTGVHSINDESGVNYKTLRYDELPERVKKHWEGFLENQP
jgi:hypothetical protein